jgi:signal peptidase II
MPETPQNSPEFSLPWKKLAVLGGVIPSILVAVDQWSKWATTQFFDVPMSVCAEADPRLTHELSPIADLSLLCNRGISWGMLQGDSSIKRWGLTLFAFLMTLVLLYVLRKTSDRLGQISLSLVIAGAVGNAIDRLFFGAVTDMIDFSDIGFNYVFNIADSYITVGVIGLFLSSFLNDRREKAAAKAAAEKAAVD